MRIMECGSCGCKTRFEVEVPEGTGPLKQEEDETYYFYCPVCSSAEPSTEASNGS